MNLGLEEFKIPWAPMFTIQDIIPKLLSSFLCLNPILNDLVSKIAVENSASNFWNLSSNSPLSIKSFYSFLIDGV